MIVTQTRSRALDLLCAGLALVLGGCVLDWDGPRPGQYTVDAALPDRAVQGDAPAELPGRDGGQDAFVADLPSVDTAADAGRDLADAGPADAGQPGNCGNPLMIVLGSGGTASISGSTAGASNDFGYQITCKSSYTFDGAQVYYLVALTGGTRYLLTLSSPGWNAALYLFKDKSCDPVKINDDCSGIDGRLKESGYGTDETMLFTPKASGSFIVAIDSFQPTHSGKFTLQIEEAPWPANITCATAQQLSLVGGKATVVSGNTLLAKDEHSKLQCSQVGSSGKTSALYGPQLYYAWAATKDQWYKLTLTPAEWSQYLYTFTSSTCSAAAIAADCQTSGAVTAGSTQANYFKPTTGGPAYFAVDSTGLGGAFTAAVEQITAPKNATCAGAQALPLVAGKGSVSGDIGPLLTPDEFSGVRCAGYPSSYQGPQVYYSVSLQAGQLYLFSLTADSAYGIMAYLFSDTCDPLVIQKDCSAGGVGSVTGSTVGAGQTGHMALTPTTAGTYKIAVDSWTAGFFGGFTLAVEALAKPVNDSCQTATVVKLTAGKATVSGVKAGATSALAACGAKLLGASDLWYRFTPTPGKQYKITFKPQGPGGRFAVFSGGHNCAKNAVEAACAILKSFYVNAGGSDSLTITGANTPVYFVADGIHSGYDLYRFTFEVEELP